MFTFFGTFNSRLVSYWYPIAAVAKAFQQCLCKQWGYGESQLKKYGNNTNIAHEKSTCALRWPFLFSYIGTSPA